MANPFVSERLVYRAVEPEDAKFFEVIGKDVPGYLNSNYSIGVPQSKARCAEYQKYVAEQTLLGVVFCIKNPKPESEGTDDELIPIGCIHLSALKPAQAHHRNSMIGIDVIPEYQGKGYGTEAILWTLKWAFEMAALHHVKICAFGYNPGALRLYQRLGFTPEGVSREDAWFRGKWYDSHSLGMLDREWFAMQSQEPPLAVQQ